MSAREEIMQRVRAGLGKGDTAARRAVAEAAMRQPVRGPQLRLNGDLATIEDTFALPRAANFIAGPLRTGDIEQTIVLGAHGPCRVHLILVEENL